MFQLIIATYLAQGYIIDRNDTIDLKNEETKTIELAGSELVVVEKYCTTGVTGDTTTTVSSGKDGHTYTVQNTVQIYARTTVSDIVLVCEGAMKVHYFSGSGGYCHLQYTKLRKP